jgi:lipid-A-disaccharide synthase-like uncharacterized protein
MLVQLSRDLGAFLLDVFWTRLDALAVFGILAQFLFAARFLVQWIASERAGRSVVPIAFWFFSVGGGLMTLVYGIVRREPVIILGQAFSLFIYARNLILIARERRARSRSGGVGGA